MRPPLLVVSAVAALLLPAVALADVPPPSGYVERCTLEAASADGQECVQRSGWHGEKGLPGRWLAEYGFCQRCQTYGASVHGDIYCRPKGGKPLPDGWDETIGKLVRDAPPEESQKPLAARCAMPPGPATQRATEPSATGAKAPDSKASDSKASDSKASGGCKCDAAGTDHASTGAGWLALGAVGVVVVRRRRRSIP